MNDTFAVRLVRARQTRSAALQTLRRALRLRVLPNELRLSVAEAEAEAPTILRFFAASPPTRHRRDRTWLSVRMAQVKSVRVKRRLLRAVLHDGHALTLCMATPSEALDAATAMMRAWGVEPLVETRQAEPLTLAQLAELFLENQRFRSLVHEMHARIASLEVEVETNSERN